LLAHCERHIRIESVVKEKKITDINQASKRNL